MMRVALVATLMIGMGSAQAAPGKFNKKRSKIVAALGNAHHSATDVLTSPGNGVTVRGKFAYGKVSKDLEKEEVVIYLLKGKRWDKLGSALTDDDGRASFEIPAKLIKNEGAHRYSFHVSGDGSYANGTIWVLPKNRKVAVFDIDGTLTTGDSELVEYILTGDTVHMRKDANTLAWHYAKKGYLPIFLTGRPYLYNAATRAWLAHHKFPNGPLVTTDRIRQGLPSNGGVGKFKAGWLTSAIKGLSLKVQAAYGNAKTDICAFAQAGIKASVTYIIGKYAGRTCKNFPKPNGLKEYSSHVKALNGGR
jgi:phosphatidate phosphatase PAH1